MSDDAGELTVRVTLPKTVRTPALDAASGRQARLSRRGVVASEDVDDPTVGRYTPAQRALAIAHAVERVVESGQVPSYTEAAARLGVTKARVLQLGRLLALSPAAQEAVLLDEVDVSVRKLERIAATEPWHEQHL
ncbi:MAG: hypothetical protein HY292_01300 [Planctomycetes bacterium]|nr:hypothetical protein [Planctomycetota bacterium]